jgi:pre-mRNA-splicing factor CDC5/CEF1
MTQTQSSLLGGENTPLHTSEGTGFAAAPRRDVIATPNPLATPLRAPNGVPATPLRPGQTPLRTPRDTLALNPVVDEETVALQKLRTGLKSLPRPKNDFELVLPEEEEEEQMEEDEISVEDAEERDRQMRVKREQEEEERLNRRSQVVRRNLPRPKNVDLTSLVDGDVDPVQKLVAEEMTRLALYDAAVYPNSTNPPTPPADFVELSTTEQSLANTLIQAEFTNPSTNPSIWPSPSPQLTSIPPSALEQNLLSAAPIDNKLEKRLSLLLGGYNSRHAVLSTKVQEVNSAIEQARIDLDVYHALQNGELIAAPTRVSVCLCGKGALI